MFAVGLVVIIYGFFFSVFSFFVAMSLKNILVGTFRPALNPLSMRSGTEQAIPSDRKRLHTQ